MWARRISPISGSRRTMVCTASKRTPAASAARTMASDEWRSSAMGFSTRIDFPALAASQTMAAWESFGVVTTTASTAGSNRSRR